MPSRLALAGALILVAAAWNPAVGQVPKIDGLSPESGPPGTSIGLTGSGFKVKTLQAGEKSALAVLVDDVGGEVSNVSDTGATIRMGGDLLVGAYKIQVVLSAYKEVEKQRVERVLGKSNVVKFDVVPDIGKLDPDRGVDGTKVLVRGGPFKPKVGGVKAVVFFDGKPMPTIEVDEKTLQFVVPKLKLGSYPVTVQLGTAKTTPGSSAKNFSIVEPPKKYGPPSIDEILPGQPKPGDSATVKGKNFRAGCTVLIDGQPTNTNLKSETELAFAFDLSLPPGPHKVQVEAKDQAVVQTSPAKVVMILPFEPVLDSLDPIETTAGGPVTCRGKQIGPGVVVYFNNAPVEKPGNPGMDKIGFNVPAGTAPGTYNVWLQVGTKRSKTLTLKIGDLNPSLKRLDPEKGKPGDMISIVGDQFGYNPTAGIQVMVDGKPATTEWHGNKSLRFAITLGTKPGSYKVEVRVGTKVSNQLDIQVELIPPVVRSVSPNPVIAGTSLTIEGNGFLEGATATLAGRTLAITEAKYDKLVVTIPVDMVPGKYALTVAVPKAPNAITRDIKDIEVLKPVPEGEKPPEKK